jgi:hypothetical protein
MIYLIVGVKNLSCFFACGAEYSIWERIMSLQNKKRRPVPQPGTGEIVGLPETLAAGTLAVVCSGGEMLALASGENLAIYRLELSPESSTASEPSDVSLPGIAAAIADSALGLLVATHHPEGSTLSLLSGRELIPLIEFRGEITALAAAGAQAYAAIDLGDGQGGRLVQVNLRQRAVAAERRLERGRVKLSVDSAGTQVVLADPLENKVLSLGADLKPRAATSDQPSPSRSAAGGRQRHDACCCCAQCQPQADDGPESSQTPAGERGGEEPAGRKPDETGERQPEDQTRHEPEQPGRTSIPADDGGIVVGNGDRVDHFPPPGRGWNPCGLSLFYTVDDLHRIGSYLLASDRHGRQVSLLSEDMNLLDQWSFGRGGAMLLPVAGTTRMVMHLRSTGKWVWQDVYESAVKVRPELDIFPRFPLASKTFIGQTVYALSHGQQPSPNEIKGLLLPVIEGDQSFNSPNLSGFSAYMKRVMLPEVKDYYDENSFGMLKNVNVSVFGVDVGPSGGPLKLPRARLADYYWPAYDPARVELVKSGATASSEIVLDGRESLSLEATPLKGGPKGKTLQFPFYALAFQRDDNFFPFQVKFLGTERLTLSVTLPDGTAKTLNLAFPARVIDIANEAEIAAKLGELASYLDDAMKTAETAAGIGSRLFAKPKAVRIGQIGMQFGRLLVTFSAANTGGNRLRITGTTSSLPGGDPMGLANPILGTMTAGATFDLNRYLENSALLAQEAAGAGYNDRLLNNPDCAFDSAASTLTTRFPISDRYGGDGATVKFVSSSGLAALFTTNVAKPNSKTTKNNAQALRDGDELFQDAFSAAIERLRQAGKPTDALKTFGAVLIQPMEPSTPNPTDPRAVLPSEAWNVTPLYQPPSPGGTFNFRGAQKTMTVIDTKDNKVQLQSAWALIFLDNGRPDNPLTCHELGHALRFGDLYHQTGYRDELGYMGEWAMMDHHPPFAHHCGYHKLQAGWIPDGAGTEKDYGRVFPIGLPEPDRVRTWDLLLVPVELWRDSLVKSARTAFGVGSDVPVVQLAWIDFGGDGATFGLIEARQQGARYSRNLPGSGGVLITNGISWFIDDRYATNTWYRRSLHLLNPANILRNPGDQFDLARAPELPVKGLKVELVDRKVVESDAQVYRIKVSRENAEFVDLYFDNPPVYYKNPDLWIDWAGNNQPNPDTLTPDYGLGQPTDQGEAIRVHPSHPEHHWVVARLRNRGQVKALDVKLNFFYFDPPGGGDGGKPMDVNNLNRYKQIGTTTFPEVPGNNDPRKIKLRWDVPPGFGGHSCLLVQIEDYKIPSDSSGAALGSDDVWQLNNHAQKNVDRYEALSGSPFAPIEFDFSVHNAGVVPELAYLEPDGLPHGMKLTVTPPQQTIAAGQTVLFHCKLELDEKIIRTGCENDQRFQLHAWRQDPESSARWGGVEYEIRPREKTATSLAGSWTSSNSIFLNGTVSPNPGGGEVYIRLDYKIQQAKWVKTSVTANGKFTWNGPATGSSPLEAIAWFEGNRKFGASRSAPVKVYSPPIVR